MHQPGRAVQVEPIKFVLKAHGTMRLKLHYDEPLPTFAFTFAFKFNLRRHSQAASAGGDPRKKGPASKVWTSQFLQLHERTVRAEEASQAGACTRPLLSST